MLSLSKYFSMSKFSSISTFFKTLLSWKYEMQLFLKTAVKNSIAQLTLEEYTWDYKICNITIGDLPLRRCQIFTIFDTYPSVGSFLLQSVVKFVQFLPPPPSTKKCRHLKLMVPCVTYISKEAKIRNYLLQEVLSCDGFQHILLGSFLYFTTKQKLIKHKVGFFKIENYV